MSLSRHPMDHAPKRALSNAPRNGRSRSSTPPPSALYSSPVSDVTRRDIAAYLLLTSFSMVASSSFGNPIIRSGEDCRHPNFNSYAGIANCDGQACNHDCQSANLPECQLRQIRPSFRRPLIVDHIRIRTAHLLPQASKRFGADIISGAAPWAYDHGQSLVGDAQRNGLHVLMLAASHLPGHVAKPWAEEPDAGNPHVRIRGSLGE
jgi:hypothetical protein